MGRIKETLGDVVGSVGAVAGGFVNAATALNWGYGFDGLGEKVTGVFWKDQPAGVLRHPISYVAGFGMELAAEAGLFSYLVYQATVNDFSQAYIAIASNVLLKGISILRSGPADIKGGEKPSTKPAPEGNLLKGR